MSRRWPGLFIVVEGPSGIGKSSVIDQLVPMMSDVFGAPTGVVKEPSSSPVGTLARELANDLRGLSLACLVAADRYQHLEVEIRPRLARGEVVICDRYVPSSLVLQVLDGVSEDFVRDLNVMADSPDLYVFLEGHAGVARDRSFTRGARDRFHSELLADIEAARYKTVADDLHDAGQRLLRVTVDSQNPDEIATGIVGHVRATFDLDPP